MKRFLAALALCAFALAAQAAQDFDVVVTIKPIHSIVAGLMRDIGTPGLLIDGEETPFTFKPGVEQKQRLQKASLVIWVGPELEKTLQPTLTQLPDKVRIVEMLARKDLKVLPSRFNADERAPFFWMDDRNAIIMLDLLTEVLIEIDPARSHVYERNRRRMLIPLKRLDREYEYGYRGLKSGVGVQYFDILHYFEQAYALKVVDQVAATPWDKVTASDLLRVRGKLQSEQANCLFLDKSMPAENAELITAGLNINTGELDVLGRDFEPGEDLYIKLMNHNTDVIKQCLNADMDAATKARLAAEAADIPDIDSLGGRFMLSNQLSQLVTEEDFRGHYSIVYFGYTSCPDVCPTTLSVLTQALKKLGDKAQRIQPYFITVDPARDKVDVMRDYVKYFDKRLIGLTGTPDMIRRVADQFKVKFEKGEVDADHPNQYTMDHSSSLFLMAPDGRFITKLAYGLTADALAAKLNEYVR
jgi:protein SCO1/2